MVYVLLGVEIGWCSLFLLNGPLTSEQQKIKDDIKNMAMPSGLTFSEELNKIVKGTVKETLNAHEEEEGRRPAGPGFSQHLQDKLRESFVKGGFFKVKPTADDRLRQGKDRVEDKGDGSIEVEQEDRDEGRVEGSEEGSNGGK